MKVVLFCGGLGMRLREYSDTLPKPMVPIGYRPILWHVMKYYAHFGHKDFILCLGYRGDLIKNYFRNYDECLSNDFVLTQGGKNIQLYNSDIQDWNITFADTGASSNIGMRLMAAKKYLEDEECFIANYTDALTDLPLDEELAFFRKQDKIGCFLCVRPNLSFHFVNLLPEGQVSSIRDVTKSALRINGGYFFFKNELFKHMRDNEELVLEPFQRLIAANQLSGYAYDGFWKNMDTFKDKQQLDDMYAKGDTPWEVWKSQAED